MNRQPDIDGARARAWESHAQDPTDPRSLSSICSWVIEGSFHPSWYQWSMACVDLADVDGLPPAVKSYPEATSELAIVSLDPAHPVEDPDRPDSLRFLTPVDVVWQFDGLDHRQIIGMVRECVFAICDGRMSPDSDYAGAWMRLLPALKERWATR